MLDRASCWRRHRAIAKRCSSGSACPSTSRRRTSTSANCQAKRPPPRQAVSKPGDHPSAVAQLRALSGRAIVFHTAVALIDAPSGRVQHRLVDVRSTFRTLSPASIEHYLRRETPYDCAGAVKSEALGIALFERIESDDPTALIGLPLIALTDMLRAEGIDVLAAAE